MNITLERAGENVPTLDVPASTSSAKMPTNVGISFAPRQTLKKVAPPPRSLQEAFRRGASMNQPRPAAPPQPPAPPPPPREVVDSFRDFANPMKAAVPPSSYGGGDGGSDDGGSMRSGSSLGDPTTNGNEEEYDDIAGDYPAGPDENEEDDDEEHQPYEDPLKPSEGFRTLDEERTDIMCKLNRLRKQGMTGLRTFGLHSDIREMRSELNRVKTEIDVEASIKWQRKMLMAMVSSLEFLNKRYDPFDLKLEGWSEQVMESLTDYDRVFERLFYKYRNKVSMPPEAELILMVGSSAFVFHLTNSMFKQNNLLQNPQFMQQMAQAMAAQQHTHQQQTQQQQQPVQPPQPPPTAGPSAPTPPPPGGGGGRHEIQAPGMDFSAFLGGGAGMMPSMMMPPPQPSSHPPPAPPRPAVQAPQVNPNNPRKRDAIEDADDRLSDIISEDLASVPDDLSSMHDSDEENNVQRISVPVIPKGKRARAGKASEPKKNVVLI